MIAGVIPLRAIEGLSLKVEDNNHGDDKFKNLNLGNSDVKTKWFGTRFFRFRSWEAFYSDQSLIHLVANDLIKINLLKLFFQVQATEKIRNRYAIDLEDLQVPVPPCYIVERVNERI